MRSRDEDDVIAVGLRGFDIVDPIGNTAMERPGGLDLKNQVRRRG